MHILLVWRPEVAGSGQEQEPFGGIEVLNVSLDVEILNAQIEAASEQHPNWHFCLMPV
jgi:hypothetical protein